MGKTYKQFSLEERCTIASLYKSGGSIRQIASSLDRSPSSISREINRNTGTGAKAVYRPDYADEMAWARRWTGSKMERQPDLRLAVLNRLAMGWSPEQVAGRLALEHNKQVISHESIYRFIYAQIRRTNDTAWRNFLPRAKFKRGFRGRRGYAPSKYNKNRTNISERPTLVEMRKQAGHWEVDLMVFGNLKANLLVAQEMVSRFIYVAKQPDKKSARVAAKLRSWFAPLPPSMRQTLTQDNGTEFAKHHILDKSLGMRTFFCDPHSPWQKGGIENTNGRLRRFIPKKTKPEEISHQAIKQITNNYNNTPRKCLAYKTPEEVFYEHLKPLHFKCESTYPRLTNEVQRYDSGGGSW
ncbi:MAG: IS30 family transposase [Devosiaceae bacterium]|nr:IS30 family transposase [Devosiaceae bacterium]